MTVRALQKKHLITSWSKEEIFEEFRKISENEEDVERLRTFLNTPEVRRGTDPLI